MSTRIQSVQEVYFLVRTGSWSEEDLNNWLQASIDSYYNDSEDIEDYDKEWDMLADDEC